MIHVKIVRKSGDCELYECRQIKRLNDSVEINHRRFPLRYGDEVVVLDERGQQVEICEEGYAVMDVEERNSV